MSKRKTKNIMHELALPDNTSAIFFHFNEDTGLIEVFLGDFSTDEIKDSEGYQQKRAITDYIESVLEEVIQDAIEEANEGIEVDEPQRVKVEGNVYSVNFSKEIH